MFRGYRHCEESEMDIIFFHFIHFFSFDRHRTWVPTVLSQLLLLYPQESILAICRPPQSQNNIVKYCTLQVCCKI
jgi:hypothetical protein